MAEQVEHASEVFKALAHPGRLRLALALCAGEARTRDLAALLGQPPAWVSRQLATLRRLGLVECRRAGRSALYRLSDPQLCAMLATAQHVASGLAADRPGRQR